MPAAPTGDFYAVPDPLPGGPPGFPIWAEQVAAPPGAIAWRILYHSRTIHDEDIAVSGLVVAPDATPPEGGFPVIAYAHGTTGLADPCAPSKAARPLADDGEATGDLPLPPMWEDGYVMVATDYEGLGTPGRHPYIVGGSEGRGVLDSIRAARALPEAHAGDQAVVVGISQGGHAALFTGELADTYAPDAGAARGRGVGARCGARAGGHAAARRRIRRRLRGRDRRRVRCRVPGGPTRGHPDPEGARGHRRGRHGLHRRHPRDVRRAGRRTPSGSRA